MLLALAALAEGREVVVSRGELVEIGDGFRIPDVLARSGARLVEVGTTNRTRAADYERRDRPRDGRAPARPPVQLPGRRLHRASVSTQELAAVARGPGSRSSTTSARARSLDLGDEPTAAASLAAGADLVCFSGDKLLGGPQAGIVVGRAELVERLRRHPLQRALRADKLTLAALEGTLSLLALDPSARDARSRCSRMLAEPLERRRGAGRAPRRPVGGEVEETVARVGGGALPLAELPSAACAVEEALFDPLRARRAARRRDRARRPPAARRARARRRRDRRGRRGVARRRAAESGLVTGRGQRYASDGADGRHRRAHRPRQDEARPGADGQGHRPAARGAGARDLDRPRLRAARAARRSRALARRRARPRAVRAHDGRRRDRDRPLPARDRRGRGRAAADARAPRDPAAARGRARRRRGHEGRPGRRGDARARARGGARARPRARRSSRSAARPATGLDELRAALEEVAGGGRAATRRLPGAAVRRPRVHAARDRHGRHGDAVVGRDRARGTRFGWSPAAATCASARCRCTTRRSSAPRPASGWPSACRASSGATCARGDALVAPGRLPALVPARGRARGARADRATAPGSRCTTGRAGFPRASSGSARTTRSCASPPRSSRRAATASSCGRRRRSAAAVVLDPAPPRRVDAERDRLLDEGDPASIVRALVHAPVPVATVAARALLGGAELEEGLDAVRVVDGWAFSDAWLEETARRSRRASAPAPRRRRSTRASRSPSSCRPSRGRVAVLDSCRSSGAGRRRFSPGRAASLGGARRGRGGARGARSTRAGLAATKVDDAELARYLETEGRLVRLGDGFAVSAGAYEVARDLVGDGGRVGRRDRARAVPRPRGRRPARRAAPARADGRRRHHAPDRRPPGAAAGG